MNKRTRRTEAGGDGKKMFAGLYSEGVLVELTELLNLQLGTGEKEDKYIERERERERWREGTPRVGV